MEKYFFKTKSNVFSTTEITDCSVHMICETVVILTRVKWLLCGKHTHAIVLSDAAASLQVSV